MPAPFVGSLTMFLCTASLATEWPAAASSWMLNIVLAAFFVMQFRLWDDLSDVDSDRRVFPHRVLCQAKSLVGFRMLLGLLFVANVSLLAYKSERSLIAFLVLNFLFLVWYWVRSRMRFRPVFSQTIVLLKYPVFVYLLSSNAVGRESMVSSSYAMGLTFLCFCIYELLHDSRLGPLKDVQPLLMVEMNAMILVGFLMFYNLIGSSKILVVVHLGLVITGTVVLVRLFQRSRDQVTPGRWCYDVFLVGFGWLLNYAIASHNS